MNTLLNRAAAARARMASVKSRGFRRALREEGAIDLASIMVGVLVIGIIGGVIAATVFAVIPWSQDEAAKGSLDAAATAESVQFTMSAGNGTGAYLTDEQLESAASPNASGKVLVQDAPTVTISTSGTKFYAVARSATGNFYAVTDTNPTTVISLGATIATAQTALNTYLGSTTRTLTWTSNVLQSN